MAAIQDKQWGTTPPISTALPTTTELEANDALVAELKKENNFESPEETEKRSCLPLDRSDTLTDVAQQKNDPTADTEDNRRVRQACQQIEESIQICHRCCWWEDLHLWKLQTWRVRTRLRYRYTCCRPQTHYP